jgi:DNA-binding transcriptional ArsR family regulator
METNMSDQQPLDPEAVASAEAHMPTPREERRMTELMEALCDRTRVRIIQALTSSETLAAGDLAHVIGRSRSATSQHLRVLRDLGAVVGRRNGNIVRYSLSPDVNGQVIANAIAAFDELRTAEGAAEAVS